MTNSVIINYQWHEITKPDFNWIVQGDSKYNFLANEIINFVFPSLQRKDKKLLLTSLVRVINFIYFKFGLKERENLFWDQLRQNKLLDLKALLLLMLPYINDNEKETNKKSLKSLNDLYLATRDGKPIYTNIQCNRCVRHQIDDKHLIYFPRPFLREYFDTHLELLMMSIETIANKLYVNWMDVIPIRMDEYPKTELYNQTVKKVIGKIITGEEGMTEIEERRIQKVNMINNYIDPEFGISYQDIYNVMSNQLFHQIKNIRWIIYNLQVGNNPVAMINYLETKLYLDPVIRGLFWPQLNDTEKMMFTNKWMMFMESIDQNDALSFHYFYVFFSKYHTRARALIKEGKLILTSAFEEDPEEENIQITPEKTKDARRGMANVPVDEIYSFFYRQFKQFKKTWYYYTLKIKGTEYITKGFFQKIKENTLYITPKNIYNYCKSMVHYISSREEYIEMPRYWQSLRPDLIHLVLIRMLDIKHVKNNWERSRGNWFNNNFYIKKFCQFANRDNLLEINHFMSTLIRTKLIDIIFESLIYHGLLSVFIPNKNITDESLIKSSDEQEIVAHKLRQMKKAYFTGETKKMYMQNSYYFLTGMTYNELPKFKFKSKRSKDYFDYLSADQNWTFTYAMNWINQINVYHHYLNNRVMFITGSTGVGKSSQMPKLLIYCLKMLDFNQNGKIICTQPRIAPTVGTAEIVSEQMGVPIREYNSVYDKDVPSAEYYIQYKHSQGEHTTSSFDSFLRITTDGTLFAEIINNPFLTRFVPDKNAIDANGKRLEFVNLFTTGNKYDIIIVDEAHEHGLNMDMILTLVRNIIYVNNSIRLVIISATMDDDEPIYRRYYRMINDNRLFPPNAFIEDQDLDRINMDRRIHINPPGATTRFQIKDVFEPKESAKLINETNYVTYGIAKAIELANTTTEKNILLFMGGQADIQRAVKEINEKTPPHIIALGLYGELDEDMKRFISKIHNTLRTYTRHKSDVFLDERDVKQRVPPGTYQRAIIVATNIAEASITLQNLKYVIDTGYAKTVVYDPIEGIHNVLTIPISRSSSEQRRGRVGRVAPGEVYYLYDKEKIYGNKTTYRITEQNIKDIIVNLLKSDPRDPFIITSDNDINNISTLKILIDWQLKYRGMVVEQFEEISPEDIIFDVNKNFIYNVLKNPQPYIDIVTKQYMYISNIKDFRQYYSYYGKTDGKIYTLEELQSDFRNYLLNNHDDYDFQEETKIIIPRTYTGYEEFFLIDKNLKYYLIHPDENIIKRNFYTGRMEGVNFDAKMSEGYYYYLLKVNKFLEKAKTDQNIDYSDFVPIKGMIAMNDAKLQLLVIDVPSKDVDLEIRYKQLKDPNVQAKINIFFERMQNYLISENRVMMIKSSLVMKLNSVMKIAGSVNILRNTNNLLWYAYSYQYNMQDDVLAILVILSSIDDLSRLFTEQKTSQENIIKFFTSHLNEKGDIYVLWKLWGEIKEIMNKYNLFSVTNIETGFNFEQYKKRYLSKEKIKFSEFQIFHRMFMSGQLGTNDEFYYYVVQSTKDIDEIMKKDIKSYIKIIAENNYLNIEVLFKFIVEYLNILFILNKQAWMYQYEMEYMPDEDILEGELEETDIIKWLQTKMALPGIDYPLNYVKTDWDKLLETYIRAYSMNLIKDEGTYYLKMSNGGIMPISKWSKKLPIEKTFLKGRHEYLIYYNEVTDNSPTYFLTPIKLDWAFQLNPIYYFRYFFGENIFKFLKRTRVVSKVLQLISDNEHLFNIQSLISYLDNLGNPAISELFRKELLKYNQMLPYSSS